jgi:anti-sigma regulatory factor (Ser/Thr protein kinase)
LSTRVGEGASRTVSSAKVQIRAEPGAPGAARAFLRAHLVADLDPERRRDVELIVSELVTNAVEHGSNPGDDIELALEPRGGTVYVGVTDRCRHRTSPALFASSTDREFGRGLLTVERLADRWGDEIVAGRRRVWAIVSLRSPQQIRVVQGSLVRGAKKTTLLDYRYILHLRDGEHDQVVRHASFRPLSPGAVLTIADTGDWIVRNLITSDDISYRGGIAVCKPVRPGQRSASTQVSLLKTAIAPPRRSPRPSLIAG